MAPLPTRALLVALISYFAYSYGTSIWRTLHVFGAFRNPSSTIVAQTEDFHKIGDTIHCEDLHIHGPSGVLFTACEDNASGRHKWFPPLGVFDDPVLASTAQGSIHVIDPKTFKSQKLAFENFNGPFITHGIDVLDDPDRPRGEAVYIFAVNHVPNPAYIAAKAGGAGDDIAHKAKSQIEVFHHVIGQSTIRHVRSVRHPLIETPNDILARSPTSILVTNDHHYREGGMRVVEDMYFGAKWSTTVHISLSTLESSNPSAGVTGNVAISGLHNNNGIGRGRSDDEILIVSCVAGTMHICQPPQDLSTGNITVRESVTIDSIGDNPFYFSDPYATPGDDKSGFLVPGLSHAINIGHNIRNPEARDGVMVTFLQEEGAGSGKWQKRVVFEDDGSRLRSVSSAVLVAIDPKETGGKRQGWLFVTGFVSTSMIALKIDL